MAPHKPEIMSPAGYWPQLHAAVEAGANAVYFGLKHFTARAKVGFTLGELPEAVRTLHQRGVRAYVTFNTLVFNHELAEAADTIATIARSGADAIIVQDLGIVRLAKQVAPDLDVHGSTQMSITSAEGVALAQSFGVSRVVLARELSLQDIRAIRAATTCELELFVHGALCVSYSGQCFSSEAWGGRSANRGQCAQACRLPYELMVDDQLRPLGDARYLLSPGDLYAIHQIPEIVEIGISALKIEGRYKDADYVALATRAYRKAVDDACAGRALSLTAVDELQLEQVYSRGLGPFFLSGTDHQRVVRGRAPRHRGVCLGLVAGVTADRAIITPSPNHLLSPLKPGDGVVFDAADRRSPEEKEEGGRVYQVIPRNGTVEILFGNGAIDFARVRPGDLLWRSHDPDLDRIARPFLEPAAPVARQRVTVRVTAHEDEHLEAHWALEEDPRTAVIVRTDEPLRAARNQALTEELLRQHLERLGNTPYELAHLELAITGRPFIPTSQLNQMRRAAVEALQQRQAEVPPRMIHQPRLQIGRAREAEPTAPQLHLLVRTPEQLEAAIQVRPASITLDYLELYGLRPSVERILAAGLTARVASPRILKPAEQRIVHFLLKLGCPILVRSAGLLHALRDQPHPPLIGDFSLNAANTITAGTLLDIGLTRLTPTHDCNAAQVVELAQSAGAESIEAIAYQHLPVFHTEHCVFCRFLSSGTSYLDCGHPCEKHRLALKDGSGRAHPVMADVGCRNTVFGAEAQHAAAHLEEWLNAGIRHFRLEFVHQTTGQTRDIAESFAMAIRGRLTAAALSQRLKQASPEGITEGSLFIPKDYLRLPVLN
ncbi:MAG: DUF3656 domain-containing protein [Bryobacteraceae bacterium]|nr:DUF3656 domain-containing protein [Bryobacteraceae bacterium]